MIKKRLENFIPVIEEKLKAALSHEANYFEVLYSAMQYSLLMGGKRLRPFILSEFYLANGGEGEDALDFAAAIEMIHTYSLIHDDLPCMDNDDFRRGKPSLHKAFTEDIALLAGDGLLTLAFETAANTQNISSDRCLKAISVLAQCAGKDGMVGGQVIDLESENKLLDVDRIMQTHIRKTGALLAASAVIGTVLAGGNKEKIAAATEYAINLGIAFQIQDDILDVIGDSAVLGKPVGSDDRNEKSSYVAFAGLDKAKQDVILYTNKAVKALEIFGERKETLKELALYLVDRNY